MNPHLPKTLLVIPVRNRRETVRAVAEASLDAGFPVLLVDDGSTDGSLDAVGDLPVGRHRLARGRGEGAALRAAAALARRSGHDAILAIDADGRHDPADARLLRAVAAAFWPAIVVGAPRMETEEAPRFGRLGPDGSAFWVRLACGTAPPDGRSPFRLYPVDFLADGKFLASGSAFHDEAFVRAVWAGYPVLRAPVSAPAPPAPAAAPGTRAFAGRIRAGFLHGALVLRSLLPWPHRRRARGRDDGRQAPSILEPGRFFRYLSREYSSAGELAAAAFVGIFVGALPIIPFGLATIVYVNHKLHLNKLAGAAASNVCVAPFVPFLCMEVGHFLRYGGFLYALDRHTLLAQIHQRLWEWLLGALVVGPVLGLAGAAVTYVLVRFLRARRQESASAVQGVVTGGQPPT